MSMARKFSSFLRARERGTSAVEFALVSPIYMLLFVGVNDFGMALYDKFALNASVSAAANYTIVNASQVGAANGSTLAQNLALIVAGAHGANWANATITVNDGPVATLSGGVVTTSGSSNAANSCYCPTLSGSAVSWGSAMTCGASCGNGGIAGKFVSIVATTTYNSLFGATGIIPTQTFTSSTVVETN